MATFALMDILEDCHSFLWLDATLEDTSDGALDKGLHNPAPGLQQSARGLQRHKKRWPIPTPPPPTDPPESQWVEPIRARASAWSLSAHGT